MARVLPVVFRWARLRSGAFRFVSELAISYRRSRAVSEGRPRLRSGPRAGDRLPDAPVMRDGRAAFLQQELAGAAFHLLLCGPVERWDATSIKKLIDEHGRLLAVRHLARVADGPDVLMDADGEAMERLGLRQSGDVAQYLVRPDGYVAFRCGGRDLAAVRQYLARWQAP
ncbi:MAG TPA: hypothetical protein VFN38_08105 [Gemmatimonadaceae bacterium]|nr:hypothetical protein [Gemmatimonadaceae bacterium]